MIAALHNTMDICLLGLLPKPVLIIIVFDLVNKYTIL